MSGGHFDYAASSLASNIFSDYLSPRYDFNSDDNKENRLFAIKENPLDDLELSELVYDICVIIHSCEWYKSGDTGYETYKKDVQAFKDKWFNGSKEERIQRNIDLLIEDAKIKLEETFSEYREK